MNRNFQRFKSNVQPPIRLLEEEEGGPILERKSLNEVVEVKVHNKRTSRCRLFLVGDNTDKLDEKQREELDQSTQSTNRQHSTSNSASNQQPKHHKFSLSYYESKDWTSQTSLVGNDGESINQLKSGIDNRTFYSTNLVILIISIKFIL